MATLKKEILPLYKHKLIQTIMPSSCCSQYCHQFYHCNIVFLVVIIFLVGLSFQLFIIYSFQVGSNGKEILFRALQAIPTIRDLVIQQFSIYDCIFSIMNIIVLLLSLLNKRAFFTIDDNCNTCIYRRHNLKHLSLQV